MNKVIIATDSSAYLPKEYVDKYQIPVLPLTVNWEGKSYYDGIDIQAEEFYQQLSQSKSMATTSQRSLESCWMLATRCFTWVSPAVSLPRSIQRFKLKPNWGIPKT